MLTIIKGVVNGEGVRRLVVGVGDGDGRQQLTGPGGGVAAVVGVHRQIVLHTQPHQVQLLHTMSLCTFSKSWRFVLMQTEDVLRAPPSSAPTHNVPLYLLKKMAFFFSNADRRCAESPTKFCSYT